MAKHTGIEIRHRAKCPTRTGGKRCTCRPTYQASVWHAREEKRIKRHFPSLAEAKAWREDAGGAIRGGRMHAPKHTTLDKAAAAWLTGAKNGSVKTRSKRPFKPSTIRGYERSLEQEILPAVGRLRLADITRRDVQRLVDGWQEQGLSASAIGNRLDPLRSIFRRAINRDEVAVNPTADLELEAAGPTRATRIVPPSEAQELLEALPTDQRAIWATAFYAGLRRGELLALHWADVDFGASEIRVSRSWDQVVGEVDPKTETSSRTIPLVAALRRRLLEHKLATGRDAADLVFGRTASEPPVPSTIRTRALAAWESAELEPVRLHEARHTFASMLIHANANAKAIQEFMGHSSIKVTFDTYGHLMPGARDETRSRVDAYLEEATAR